MCPHIRLGTALYMIDIRNIAYNAKHKSYSSKTRLQRANIVTPYNTPSQAPKEWAGVRSRRAVRSTEGTALR